MKNTNELFCYDDKRTATETSDIEMLVMSGGNNPIVANEVLNGYLDYIFTTLLAIDKAYMNRDQNFTIELRLEVLKEGISRCLSVVSIAKSVLRHYPRSVLILDGLYSSIRFQDVFTYNAIYSEMGSGSLFETGNTTKH